MKKIFTLFAALAMVMSMSAQTLYLRGDFNTWGTTNKLDANGQCEIELKVGNYGFKVADANWSGNYNFGSSATISETTTGVKFTKGSNDNCTLKATTAGVYTFKFNLSTLELDVTYPQGEVVEIAPTVAVLGEFNGWNTTANTLTNDSENKTATTVIKLTAGTTKFKVLEDSKWLGDNQTVTREKNSQVFSKVDGADCYLNADVAGDYTFTWTFETNTLVVTYPEAGTTPDPETPVEPEEPEVTYVLMGVAGDWTTGITMTQNPDNANEYVLLGQEIAEGDAVKVVTLTDGTATAWCGNVDEYSVERSYDDNGNIVLAPGKYDFYFKVDAAIIYIGGTPSEEPGEPEIEWMEMELEINNLTTEVMEVGGAKYLQLNGRNDMEDADVTLFLNNYADVDDDYTVNAESSYLTYGGMELTVIEGTISQVSETENGTIYQGKVRASLTDEEEGGTMYLEFSILMYTAPATPLVLTNAIVAINEETGTLTFNVPTEEGEGYYVELAGYTEPGVYEGPQVCLLETPEVVAFGTYAEVVVENNVYTLTCKGMASPMGSRFDLTVSGTVQQGPTGVENLNGAVAPVKVIENGQIFIIRNGVKYNAQGAQL